MSPPEYRPQSAPIAHGISTVGGANIDGKPFVHVHVDGEPYGQLTPGEAITFGIRVIQSAIEAERDSGIVRALTADSDDPEEAKRAAGAMLVLVRSYRDQWDPETPVTWREPEDIE